jgi:SAM-dependent methyltransferase
MDGNGYDGARAEAFGERMGQMLNASATALLLSLGHGLGLFDTMATSPPVTAAELAETTGLTERYLREWLDGLVVSDVLEHDPEGDTYRLPAEHAAFLTRAAGPDNLAFQTRYIGLLADVEADIEQAFREGGGVPYTRFGRFHSLMAEESRAWIDAALLETVLPAVAGVAADLERGIDVADVGCGSGHALNVMAESFPASRFAGFDIADEALDTGRKEAAERGLTNVRFERRDAARGLDGEFDLITTIDSVHDQARPDLALAGIAAAVRPGGKYLMIDIRGYPTVEENRELPFASWMYAVSLFHCMTVSLAEPGGMGLGTMWGRATARRMLADAGFTDVRILELEADLFNDYYVCRR